MVSSQRHIVREVRFQINAENPHQWRRPIDVRVFSRRSMLLGFSGIPAFCLILSSFRTTSSMVGRLLRSESKHASPILKQLFISSSWDSWNKDGSSSPVIFLVSHNTSWLLSWKKNQKNKKSITCWWEALLTEERQQTDVVVCVATTYPTASWLAIFEHTANNGSKKNDAKREHVQLVRYLALHNIFWCHIAPENAKRKKERNLRPSGWKVSFTCIIMFFFLEK